MNLSRFRIASVASLAAMALVSLWGISRVGLDATVPIHWDANGNPNGYASSLVAFVTTPLIAVAVIAVLAAVPKIEPRRENLERSAGAYQTVAIALVLLMVLVHVGVVLAGTGSPMAMGTLVGVGIGGLFAILGNVMGQVRSNFMFGIRTPWTLSSDLAWDRTHRLIGRLWVGGGLAMVVLSLTGLLPLVIAVLIGFIVVTLAVAIVYSYRVWASDPDRRGGSTR
jgi:uncharacterized membrane protein